MALTTIVSHAFGRSLYGLVLPAIEADLGIDHDAAGLGGTVIFAAYLVGVAAVALLANRFEPIGIMRTGLAVAAVGLVILSTAQSLPTLYLGLALSGGAGAGIWITAPAIATAGIDVKRRGLVIGFLSGTIGLGTFVLGFGTRFARDIAGDEGLWRPVYVVAAIVTLALLTTAILAVRPEATDRVGGGFSFDGLRAVPNWVRVTVAYAAFGFVAAAYLQFLTTTLEQDIGLSRATASSVFALVGLMGAMGAPLLGMLSDRVGRRLPLQLVMAAIVFACLTLAVGRGPVVGFLVVAAGGMMSAFPILVAAYVRDTADARAFNAAFGAMTICYSVVAVTAPGLAGWLAERSGSFTLTYLMLAAVGGVALVLLVGLPRVAQDSGT